jgi:ADP-ribose pyrophosphatase YjhB (NUDIX family)
MPRAFIMLQTSDNRALILQTPNGLRLPGGEVADGESPEQAARRNLRAQTGIVINDSIRLTEIVHDDEVGTTFIHFVDKPIEDLRLGGGATCCGWLDAEFKG